MLTLALLAAATMPDPGPAPDRSAAMQVAQAEVSATLVDPASAIFTWPYTIEVIEQKPLLGQRTKRWRTCGTLNARNKMGGYAGTSFVIAEFENGRLVATGIGEDDRTDPVNIVCEQWIKKGMIRPVDTGTATQLAVDPVAAASKGVVGIAFMPSPVGAVILAVAPGSIAEKAGLKPGQTIEAVNGISLKGLSQADAMVILRALPSTYVMTMAGSPPVTISHP